MTDVFMKCQVLLMNETFGWQYVYTNCIKWVFLRSVIIQEHFFLITLYDSGVTLAKEQVNFSNDCCNQCKTRFFFFKSPKSTKLKA